MANYSLGLGLLGNQSSGNRTLGIRDKRKLYAIAGGVCEACKKKIEEREMNSGHIKASAKGGKATIRNSVCLCWSCNNLQGTKDYYKFMKEMGWELPQRLKAKQEEKEKSKAEKPKKKKRSSGTNLFGIRTSKNNPFGL